MEIFTKKKLRDYPQITPQDIVYLNKIAKQLQHYELFCLRPYFKLKKIQEFAFNQILNAYLNGKFKTAFQFWFSINVSALQKIRLKKYFYNPLDPDYKHTLGSIGIISGDTESIFLGLIPIKTTKILAFDRAQNFVLKLKYLETVNQRAPWITYIFSWGLTNEDTAKYSSPAIAEIETNDLFLDFLEKNYLNYLNTDFFADEPEFFDFQRSLLDFVDNVIKYDKNQYILKEDFFIKLGKPTNK